MLMRNLMRMGMLAVVAMAAATSTMAQDKPEATLGVDLVSQYVWRGQDLGDVSVQPTLGVGYKGLSLTAWGNVGLSDNEDTKEFDLTLDYTYKAFSVGVTDYWFNKGTTQDGEEVSDARYFHYNAHSTTHVFEGYVGYDFGPVALKWYTNFAGNDGVNKSGKRAYSSYMEANVPFRFATCDWTATIGAVPYRTSFYAEANGFAVTNIALKATKDIQVTKSFDIPVFAQIMTNPSTQKAYFVFGLTLHP